MYVSLRYINRFRYLRVVILLIVIYSFYIIYLGLSIGCWILLICYVMIFFLLLF